MRCGRGKAGVARDVLGNEVVVVVKRMFRRRGADKISEWIDADNHSLDVNPA